jgi:hypothetical protein
VAAPPRPSSPSLSQPLLSQPSPTENQPATRQPLNSHPKQPLLSPAETRETKGAPTISLFPQFPLPNTISPRPLQDPTSHPLLSRCLSLSVTQPPIFAHRPATAAPSTDSCRADKTQRPAALWSHRRPFETENKGETKRNRAAKRDADLQNKRETKTKINCCCALFPLLQVSVTFTAGVGRQRRGRRPRSTGSATFSQRRWRVEQRAATVVAVQKAFPAIYGVFRGYFVNLKLCNVIFV